MGQLRYHGGATLTDMVTTPVMPEELSEADAALPIPAGLLEAASVPVAVLCVTVGAL